MRYICTYCSVHIYDDQKGDPKTGLRPGLKPDRFPSEWHCPVCGKSHDYMQAIGDEAPPGPEVEAPVTLAPAKKDINYYRSIARKQLTGTCGEFNVCDGGPGRTCYGQKFGDPLGLGGAGQGNTFHANYLALQKFKFKERIVKAHAEPDMSTDLFGQPITAPVTVASMSGVKNSFNDAVPEVVFYRGILDGSKNFGTIGMVGNTAELRDDLGIEAIKDVHGHGIPVFKPQSQQRLIELFRTAEKAGALAIGVDLDGCGSLVWARKGRPVYRKTPGELKELVDATERPVFFKGIMSNEDAGAVVDSGADALYISNHGGRVLDSGLGVADVLPEIAEEYGNRIMIMADGAVRTGFDVLKLLALGADMALIGRPLGRMSIAGGAEAVRMYLEYVRTDLRLGMIMTGCDSLEEVHSGILVHAQEHRPSGRHAANE
jgi:rubredoxin/NAD(P)H-dependent flavin oxidoreductase YrpB (nitropropane dioxygenase family)